MVRLSAESSGFFCRECWRLIFVQQEAMHDGSIWPILIEYGSNIFVSSCNTIHSFAL